jgi:hypothetical protein
MKKLFLIAALASFTFASVFAQTPTPQPAPATVKPKPAPTATTTKPTPEKKETKNVEKEKSKTHASNEQHANKGKKESPKKSDTTHDMKNKENQSAPVNPSKK